jgi:hypothetical protein
MGPGPNPGIWALESIRDIDLEYVQEGFKGLEYRKFIKLHFRMASCDELLRSIASNYAAFNSKERKAAKEILRVYDQYATDPNFWLTDTGQVLKEMSESFEKILKTIHCRVVEKMKFNLFHLVSANLAVLALYDKELRRTARIRKSRFTKS